MRATEAGWLDYVDRFIGDARVEQHSEETPVWLFSADHRPPRTIAGGKVVHGISVLWLQSLRIYRDRGEENMAGRLFSKMRDLVTEPQNEYVRLRATGISRNGSALVMPSSPNSHLPALAGRIMQKSGGRFLGDEVVKLDPILRRVSPVDWPLLIDERDAHLFPEGEFAPVHKRRKEPQYIGGATPRRPLALRSIGVDVSEAAETGWLVFPEFLPGEESRLEPWGGAAALFKFTEATLNMHIWSDRTLMLAREMLAAHPVSRLVVGSIEEASDLVSAELDNTLGT
ncbi:MAG: hypothetical protein ACRDJ0_13180 [Actinomycetota bacterium]